MTNFLTLDTDITNSQSAPSELPKKICVVMPGIVGPDMADLSMYQGVSDIVGVCDGLVRILAEEGHGVVVAYIINDATDTLLIDKARMHYARYDVILKPIASIPPIDEFNILDRKWQSIWALHDWLRTQEKFFDVVHIPDWKGLGYGALLAKSLGLAFRTTHFVVHGLSPTLWRTEREWRLLSDEEELGWVFAERRCVELADTFVCADEKLMTWMSDVGYRIPTRSFLSPCSHYPAWTKDCWIVEDNDKTSDASHWRDVWLHWHAQSKHFEAVVAQFIEKMQTANTKSPSVTICIVHYERPSLVRMAVDSVLAQNYAQLDAILIDNGSENPGAKEAVEEIEVLFQKRDWRVLRQENRCVGAARNAAAAEAQGDWLLFLDDDDLLFPDAVSRLVHAACFSGADAIPAAYMRFSGHGDPRDNTSSHIGPLRFLGAARTLNILGNVAGGTGILVRRSAFVAAGGFGEEYGVALEDMAFLNRLMGIGFRIEPLPDPAYFYRIHAKSTSSTWRDSHNFLGSRYLVFSSHARSLPVDEQAFSAFSLAHYLRSGALGDELADREARIGALGDELADREARIGALGDELADREARIGALGDELADREARIGALGDELADREARIGALGDELADREARIGALGDELADREARIGALGDELADREARIGALGDELADREARIGALGDELADREARIGALYNSRSWRMTSPLRSVGRATRRSARFTRRIISKIVRRAWNLIPIPPVAKTLVKDRLFERMPRLFQHSYAYQIWRQTKKSSVSVHAFQTDGVNAATHGQKTKTSLSWGIVTMPHTLFIAKSIKNQLRKYGWNVDIITDPSNEFFHDMYIVICPQVFKNLPPFEKMISFQLEQSVSCRWFTDDYLDTLNRSFAVLEYATYNFPFLKRKGIDYPNLYYLPVGGITGFGQTVEKSIKATDVLFYGDNLTSTRRQNMLSALNSKFNVRIENNLYGHPMTQAIREARVVINLHYYENALLEVPRIWECLSLGTMVVSESAKDQDDYPELHGAVKFFEQGSIDSMVYAVKEVLENPIPEKEISFAVEESEHRFSIMFENFLLGTGVLPSEHVKE